MRSDFSEIFCTADAPVSKSLYLNPKTFNYSQHEHLQRDMEMKRLAYQGLSLHLCNYLGTNGRGTELIQRCQDVMSCHRISTFLTSAAISWTVTGGGQNEGRHCGEILLNPKYTPIHTSIHQCAHVPKQTNGCTNMLIFPGHCCQYSVILESMTSLI